MTPRLPRLPSIIGGGLVVTVLLGTQIALGASHAVADTTFTVSTTADIAANAGACGNAAITTAPNPLSLREATCLANNVGGTVTIDVPAGTYVLSHGELDPGVASGQNVTIAGAGAATTIINGNNASRVLNFDENLVGGVTAAISGVTITGGADSTFGGAGIIGGSGDSTAADSLTITDSVVSGNTANGASHGVTNDPGGGVQFIGGVLSISGSTFSNNSSFSSPGSGVAYVAEGAASPESLSITGSTFSGNVATNSNGSSVNNGGALYVAGPSSVSMSVTGTQFTDNAVDATSGGAVGAGIYQDSGALTVTGSTFVGNSATGTSPSGGAIEITTGTEALHYNRFTGNVASSGQAIAAGVGAGTVNATDNWYGCNGSPGATGCDTVAGSLTASPHLALTGSAVPSTVNSPNGISTVTASLLTDSNGSAVDPANLGAFSGLPISWTNPTPAGATINSGSTASTTVVNGTSTATYDSQNAVGSGGVTATLDNGGVTVPVTVDQAPQITTNPQSQTVPPNSPVTFTAAATGFPTPTVQWQVSTNGGSSFSNVMGANSMTYTHTAVAAETGNEYQAVFTNSAGHATTSAATLTVAQAPAITSADSTDFPVGVLGSFTVTTTGTPTPAISETGALPNWLSLTDNGDGTATLAGTPPPGSEQDYTFTLAAINGVSPAASQPFTLTVDEAPSITSADSTTFTVGDAGTFTVTTNPGFPTATALSESGALPGGVTFTDNGDGTATLAGPPADSTAGSYPFTIKADNGVDSTTQPFTLTVQEQSQTINVTSSPPDPAEVGGTYPLTATASSNLTVAFSIDPTTTNSACSLSGSTVHLNNPGSCVVDFNQSGNGTFAKAPQIQQTFTVGVAPAITSADSTDFPVGALGSFTVTTTGTPTPAISENGALPDWLTLTDNGDGTATLAGTPPPGSEQDYTFTLSAENGFGPNATQPFTLTVDEAPSITSADKTTFTVGVAGTFTVTTNPGFPTSTALSENGALPGGVTFTDNGDGTATLAGTPADSTAGSYPFTIKADNGAETSTQPFTLTVQEQSQTINVTSSPPDPAEVGGTYPLTATASSNLTVAFSIDPTTTNSACSLSGSTVDLDNPGSCVVDFNQSGNGTFAKAPQIQQTFTVGIAPAISSADNTDFPVGALGSFTVTTTGTPTPAISETGALPNWLTLTDNGDGTATLAGTPPPGSDAAYTFTLTADNGFGPKATQLFTLTVDAAPSITSADSTTFSVGVAGTFTVTTNPGFPTATALSETGALPGGVTFTDNGDGTATLAGPPADSTAGSYPFTIKADNGVDSTTQPFTLTVQEQSQTINVTSSPPDPAEVGGTYPLTATASSNLTVAFSIDPTTTNSACSLSGSTVDLDQAGSCVVDFNQSGNGTFAKAPQIQQTFTVGLVGTQVGVTTTPGSTSFGEPVTATATITADSGTPAGGVQFEVDGHDLGASVPVSGGTATSGQLTDSSGNPLAPGSHTITAIFTPTDPTTYAGSQSPVSLVVSKADTSSTVTVTANSVSSTVTAVAPGAGTPTGTVTFTVNGNPLGSAPLSGGVATLHKKVPTAMTAHVAASYGGDSDFNGSSASTSRHNPTITAKVSSAHHKTHFGWYRSPVTVSFHCTTNGAALTGPCPAAVTLSHNGGGKSVTRTITATDGGTATVVVSPINIDQTPPKLRVSGVRNGATYDGVAPVAHCVAKDPLSGVASCRLTQHTHGTTTDYTATAKDRAGNKTTVTGHYRTLGISIEGASFTGGAFNVKEGGGYTLVVHSSTRPTYYDAAPFPTKPFKRDPHVFSRAGHDRWTIGVTMVVLTSHKYWNIGVKIGHVMHVIKIRVAR